MGIIIITSNNGYTSICDIHLWKQADVFPKVLCYISILDDILIEF